MPKYSIRYYKLLARKFGSIKVNIVRLHEIAHFCLFWHYAIRLFVTLCNTELDAHGMRILKTEFFKLHSAVSRAVTLIISFII